MRTRGFVLPLGLLLAMPLVMRAQEPTVAVLDFTAFSVTLEDASAVGKGLASMIATELSSRPRVKVLERQEVESLIERRQLQLSGRVDDKTALQVGQLLGAHYVVVGSVALEKQNARVDIRILSVESGQVYKSMKRTGKRDDFLAMVDELADSFTKDLKLPERAVVAEVIVPAPAVVAYSRGLDYERRGNKDRAVQMYQRALSLFPTYADARAGLDRVK